MGITVDPWAELNCTDAGSPTARWVTPTARGGVTSSIRAPNRTEAACSKFSSLVTGDFREARVAAGLIWVRDVSAIDLAVGRQCSDRTPENAGQ